MEDSPSRPAKGEGKQLTEASVAEYNARLARRGVVYLSRIPPFMKPQKVKHLLAQHGEVTRVFLASEDKSDRKRRVKTGGSKSKIYREGWVEFEDKKIARLVAKSLNNTKIGGSKRSYYHEDIWNIKYLKGFKWEHLTEKLAYERRIREHRMRAEMMQARRENAMLVDLADKGKAIRAMESRKRKGREEPAGEGARAGGGGEGGDGAEALRQIRRRFKQRKPIQSDQVISRSARRTEQLRDAVSG